MHNGRDASERVGEPEYCEVIRQSHHWQILLQYNVAGSVAPLLTRLALSTGSTYITSS